MLIYKISAEYQKLLDESYNPDTGEFYEDKLQELSILIQNFEEEVIIKAQYIKNIEAMADILNREINLLDERENKLRERANKIKKDILQCMQNIHKDKIESPCFEVKVKLNPPRVDKYDENIIPSQYIKEHKTNVIDTQLLHDDLKAGFEIPGARLVQLKRLEIK